MPIKNKTVIIVNGYPQSGKTLFAEILAQETGVIERSSVGLVKELYKKYFGWDGSKTPESRLFLSNFKQFLIRETELIERDLDEHYELLLRSKDKEFLLIDIREPEEIERFKLRYNAITLFVDRVDAPTIEISNTSDASVENYTYDYILKNPGEFHTYKDNIQQLIKELRVR